MAGVVSAVQDLSPGDTVGAGQVVAVITPGGAGSNGSGPARERDRDDTWAPVLDEVKALQDLAAARLAPGSDEPGVVRQRNRGKLNCR